MKKEIKSYEELAKHHLKYFTAIFNGEIIDGTVLVYDDFINLHYKQKNMDGIIHLIHIEPSDVIIKSSISNLCIEVEEEWMPKLGECVFVGDCEDDFKSKMIGYFLFEKNGLFHVVLKSNIGTFHSLGTSTGYMVYKYKFIKKYEQPKIELNIDEARKIIAANKGVRPENVTIKGL